MSRYCLLNLSRDLTDNLRFTMCVSIYEYIESLIFDTYNLLVVASSHLMTHDIVRCQYFNTWYEQPGVHIVFTV